MAFGGGVAACAYKAANTMDSMLGYQNEKYRDIGFFSAKFDDVMNYIPSRLTALLMIVAAFLLRYDAKNAWRIWRRDRRNHASPNSAQTESVCAGALGLRLAGDAYYFGELHKKPYIGDDLRPIEPEDIRRTNKLMYVTAILMLLLSCTVRGILGGLL
jgi:adenosylcobinamide-phosphate synthase